MKRKFKSGNGLYGVYSAKAINDKESFIGAFARKNIPLYDLKFSESGVSFASPLINREKIFAISDNMCYNVRETGYKGRFAPIAKIAKNIGLVVVFSVLCAFGASVDNYVGKICYSGDGKYLKEEIEVVLSSEGIRIGEKFPDNLSETAKKIASLSEKVEFASVSKKGRTLLVDVRAAVGKTTPLNERKTRIVSPVSGVVRRVSRYGGTALVKSGDSIKKGDVLIDGYYEKEGEKIVTDALGDVEIAVTEKFDYNSGGEGKEYAGRAMAVAREKFGDKDIIEITARLTAPKTYTVTVVYAVIAN